MLKSAFRDLYEYAKPIHFLVRRLLPRMWRSVARVGALAVAGAAMNAAGFLMLLPILNAVARNESSVQFGIISMPAQARDLGILLVFALLLVVAGLYLRFRITNASLDAQRQSTQISAVIGLRRLRCFTEIEDLPRAVSRVTGKVSNACGFVMRQFASGLADALQLLVFFSVLLWLSPLLTLGLMIPAVLVLIWFTRSLNNLNEAVSSRAEKRQGLKEEVFLLADMIDDPNVKSRELSQTLARLHREGAHGRSIAGKLSVRREIRRGPIIVEALFPLALVPLALIGLSMDDWQHHAPAALIYVLLLRSVISMAQRLSGQLLMVGRFRPEIICFAQLHGDVVPELLMSLDADRDDEEEA